MAVGELKILGNAPDFTANDSEGRKITLYDYTNKKNIVLVFNRGFW